jgi:hypothetical protein
VRNFLAGWMTTSFPRMTLLHGVSTKSYTFIWSLKFYLFYISSKIYFSKSFVHWLLYKVSAGQPTKDCQLGLRTLLSVYICLWGLSGGSDTGGRCLMFSLMYKNVTWWNVYVTVYVQYYFCSYHHWWYVIIIEEAE